MKGTPSEKGQAASFWRVIRKARAGQDEERFQARLQAQLRRLSPAEIVAFERQFQAQIWRANTWDLWGAAYLINGGCSDDCFVYFRFWLVAQGEEVYGAALKQPDSLATRIDPDAGAEGEWYLPARIYREKTGKQLPDVTPSWAREPDAKTGWDFDDAAQMRRRYPRLYARLRGEPSGAASEPTR